MACPIRGCFRWVLKAAGAFGLLLGIGVPTIGLAASIGLVLLFVGAVATVMRAGW